MSVPRCPRWFEPDPPDEGDHDGFTFHWDDLIDQEESAETAVHPTISTLIIEP